MLFNSITFALFLPIVFIIYWFVFNKNIKTQNITLLLASYVFYAWWDWRFLFLLIAQTFFNYGFGLAIQGRKKTSGGKAWFILALIFNLSLLSVFKYFNFFIKNFVDLFTIIDVHLQPASLKIILPLGISFYTFLSLSYIVDIYRNKLEASKNIINVLLTLSFFPIILAGPIQRPIKLLPQIQKSRIFKYDKAVDGLRQILWGLFMKIVIADNCAIYTNDIFSNFNDYSGSTLVLGALFYTIQIYSDFAGYSNIAIGVARLLGFDIMQNFATPYFSRNIADFWKRWHISLTEWFRDYLFLPVAFGLSRKFKSEKILFVRTDLVIYAIGIFITWFLTGLWHGANYTFIIWGALHGSFLIYHQAIKKLKKKLLKKLGFSVKARVIVILESFMTFCFVVVSWVIFKSSSISDAYTYIEKMFSSPLNIKPEIPPLKILVVIFLFLIIEWFQRNQQHGLQFGNKFPSRIMRWSIYFALVFVLLYFGGSQQEFVYLKF